MRLGGYYKAEQLSDLEPLCERMDELGLSAIAAPSGLAEWLDEECVAFGERASQLGLVIGEMGYWHNLLIPDPEIVEQHIVHIRTLLRKADLMGVRCVVTLIGSRDPSSPLSPAAFNFSDEARSLARETCLRIVDGLDLTTTRYALEPWVNSFFWKPDDVHSFLQSVDHPFVRLHMDQMNLVSPETYFATRKLINHSFDLLADYIVSVHAKDILWTYGNQRNVLQFDEVYVGDGVMDYNTYLSRLNELDPDMPVFTEHFSTEEQYLTALNRLHEAADAAGMAFVRRTPQDR